jgi:hypothetical protein
MLNTRCPGVQATRMLQAQNKKEANNTRMMCNEVPRGHQAHYTPSPPRASKDLSPTAARPRPMLPNLMGSGTSGSASPSMSDGSMSPQRLPILPPPGSRPPSVVSPSRRTFHMSPNDRRAFYAQFVDRPSTGTIGVAQQWRQ